MQIEALIHFAVRVADKLTRPTDPSVLDIPDNPNGKGMDADEIALWLRGGPRPTSHLPQGIGNGNGSPNGHHPTEVTVFNGNASEQINPAVKVK